MFVFIVYVKKVSVTSQSSDRGVAIIERNGGCTGVILFHSGIEPDVVFRGRWGGAGVVDRNRQNFVKCCSVAVIEGSQMRRMRSRHREAYKAGYDSYKNTE